MPEVDVVERLLELCGHLCVTGHEAPIADALQEHYADHPIERIGDSLVVGAPGGDRPLVLLVGHLDVVPPTELDEEPRIEERSDGDVVVGRGTSDMKGGVAVAEVLFADEALRTSSPYATALVLYAGEEGPAEANELGAVLAGVPWLTDAELAIVLEPTDLEIQAGCLGGLHAQLTFQGRAAHSARPWHGENALTKAGALLTELHGRDPVEVTVDGMAFHDVLTATQATTDNARNVIPERFVVNVNYRFAPDRTLEEAEAQLLGWVDGRAEVEIVDRAPPAPPQLGAPLVSRFVGSVQAPLGAKQAWTDVARLVSAGVPALNFGPGLTGQAHQAGEFVPVANLRTAVEQLRRFLDAS